jgi:hypothetical protein
VWPSPTTLPRRGLDRLDPHSRESIAARRDAPLDARQVLDEWENVPMQTTSDYRS